MVRRLLICVTITESSFQSTLFNKICCCVDRKKEIYYTVVESFEAAYSKKKFIIISNQPFCVENNRGVFPKKIIQSYDLNNQILLPYDSNTFNFFELSNWEYQNNNTGDGSVC